MSFHGAYCNHSYSDDANHTYQEVCNSGYMRKPINEIIKELRKTKGLSQERLGSLVGVSRVAVTKWESGDTQNLKHENLVALAKVFGISVDQLIRESDGLESTKIAIDPEQIANVVRFIPRISWVQAGMWTEIVDHLAPGDAEEMIACHKNIGKHGFALKIKGKSMEPDFKEGDLVLIDPDLQPNPGDFVVAKNSEEEATFKRYRPRGMNDKGEFYFELVPLNEDFETMRSDRQSIQIIGVAIDHIRSLR